MIFLALFELRRKQDIALIIAAIAAFAFTYFSFIVQKNFALYLAGGIAFVAPAYYFLLGNKEIRVSDIAAVLFFALLLPLSMGGFAVLTKTVQQALNKRIV